MMVSCSASEGVYTRHVDELVRFASGLIGPDHAPDVVADAFVRLTRSAAWAEANNHRALWFRAVVFEAQSWKRSTARRRAREQRSIADRSLAPLSEPTGIDRVGNAVDDLSAQQRAVIVLAYWQDLDPSAIAVLLDVSEGTVRKQLSRAREKLRKVLQ